jgi:hypothetical protein
MKNSKLVICPSDPAWTPPDRDGLETLLQSLRFLGKPCPGRHAYWTGEHFLDLIAFMGCSPGVRLEPEADNEDYCYINLACGLRETEFHAGEHVSTPRCPQCGAPFNDWQAAIGNVRQSGTSAPWTCAACGHRAAPWAYRWRKSAGFGRCFIEINNIFPREAIPQQQLLDTLNSHYRVNWRYFYQY